MDMHWSPDGTYLACGHVDGDVVVRDVNGYEYKKIPSKNAKIPVFQLKFSPKSGNKTTDSKLAVITWNRQLVFYDKTFGTMSAVAKNLAETPISMCWFSDGQILCIGFNTGGISCYNRDGIFLNNVDTMKNCWITSICTRPNRNEISFGTMDGEFSTIGLYQSVIFSIWKDR